MKQPGYVYILTNPSLKDYIVKIGLKREEPDVGGSDENVYY